jgi:hypothetical protein
VPIYHVLAFRFAFTGKLVIDKSIASLPRRQTDGAIIVRSQDTDTEKARVFKLNATAGDPILLERYACGLYFSLYRCKICCIFRPNGYERQYRFLCPRCTLPIGYQTTPPPVKSGPFLYIIAGSLTQMQGHLPQDAFDGEEKLAS